MRRHRNAIRFHVVGAREATDELRVSRAAVLVNVEPFELAFFRDAERTGCFDCVHQHEAHHHGARGDGRATNGLADELRRATAIEEAGDDGRRGVVRTRRAGSTELAASEQAEAERAPDAADAVHGHCAYRVVNTEPLHHVDAEDDDDAGDQADHDRAERRDPVTGARDGDETGEEAVHGDAAVPDLVARVHVSEGRETTRASGERGVRSDATATDVVHRRERAARVEPVPAEPEDDAADGGDHHVVARRHAAAVTLELATQARSEGNRAAQGDEAADRVHDRGTSEIVERGRVDRVEPAIRTPRPVAEDRIDEPGHAEAVQQVADEAGPTDHGAGGDGAAGIREGELEQEERQERDTRSAVRIRCTVQQEVLLADEAVTRTEHEGKAPRPEQDAAQAGVDDAFQEDVHRFASTRETCLQHHEACLHEEHQERGDEHPERVHGVHVSWRRRCRIIGMCNMAEEMVGNRDCDEQCHNAEQFTRQDDGEQFATPWLSPPFFQFF